MEGLRRAFGIAEPVKRAMELQICRAGEARPALLGPSAALSSDVLAGRDTEVGWQDVFKGMLGWPAAGRLLTCVGDETRDVPDFHTEMQQKLRMNW